MVRTQIQLTNQQSSMLKSLAVEESASIAELIRRSIDQFLQFKQHRSREELKQNSLSIVGRYSSGLNDVALNHDAYLADIYGEVD